jgi:aryl-alcohol dehydrogenase-like predicted oxidoreductase
MRELPFGPSGIRVSHAALGTMTFGTQWALGTTEDSAQAIYGAYRDAGGNFLDCANNYGAGESEEILGRLIASHRDEVVVATKFGLAFAADSNAAGAHPKSMRRSVEQSLRRLGTDHLDILWVHLWDETTPMETTLRALDGLVRSGKVLALGISNTPAWVVARANTIAEAEGWTPFSGIQVSYGLAERTPERELLPMATALGMAVTAWSPLARGVLAGKPREGMPPTLQAAFDAVDKAAAGLGVTPAQVAIAYVLAKGVVPVLGATTLPQIEDNLAGLSLQLDDDVLAALDVATRPELGYPHDFLAFQRARTPQGS